MAPSILASSDKDSSVGSAEGLSWQGSFDQGHDGKEHGAGMKRVSSAMKPGGATFEKGKWVSTSDGCYHGGNTPPPRIVLSDGATPQPWQSTVAMEELPTIATEELPSHCNGGTIQPLQRRNYPTITTEELPNHCNGETIQPLYPWNIIFRPFVFYNIFRYISSP